MKKVASSGGFTPADLTGLQAWYDASDTGTITASSGDVSQLDDKSGNGYHFTQGIGANQPRTGDNTINSLNVLTFNSSNSETMRNNAFYNLSGKRFTIFAVFYVSSTASDSFGRFFIADEGSTTAPANTIEMGAYKSGNSLNRIVTSVSTTKNLVHNTDEAHIRTWYTTGTSWHVRINAAEGTGSPFSVGDGLLNSSTAFAIIGGRLDDSSADFTGHLCEIIVCDGYVGDTERDQAESYLATKWGVTI